MTDIERIPLIELIPITGLKKRALQHLAATGKIPGAAKLGSRWTVDLIKVRRWIAEREAAAQCQMSISEEKHGGVESRLPASSIAAAYEQAIRRRPGKEPLLGRGN